MDPQPHPDTPTDGAACEVVITDAAMQQLRHAPPAVVDQLADTIAQIRQHGPEAVVQARALTPHPVDHSPGRPPVHVPATRSVGYLRAAVEEISPPTVATFDQELREDTHADTDDARIRGLREFIGRWVEYIALHGDHEQARHLEQAQDSEEFSRRLAALMTAAYTRHFPDARGRDLSVRCEQGSDGRWTATDPVTHLRYTGPTHDAAFAALRAGLLEMVRGY